MIFDDAASAPIPNFFARRLSSTFLRSKLLMRETPFQNALFPMAVCDHGYSHILCGDILCLVVVAVKTETLSCLYVVVPNQLHVQTDYSNGRYLSDSKTFQKRLDEQSQASEAAKSLQFECSRHSHIKNKIPSLGS